MTTVLFWDIDGTLINTLGAGRLALTQAVEELTGSPTDLSYLKMAGMTDWGIAIQVLQQMGREPTRDNILELLEVYQAYLGDSLVRTQGHILSGVKEILESLKEHPEVCLLLLTGNIQAGAYAKLSYYGLESYFVGGAFCEDSADRNDIARTALNLAQEKLGEVSADKCYVIGDTPHDIRCGQAIGARTIALASHHYSVEDLTAYNSWLVWDKFPSPESFKVQINLGF